MRDCLRTAGEEAVTCLQVCGLGPYGDIAPTTAITTEEDIGPDEDIAPSSITINTEGPGSNLPERIGPPVGAFNEKTNTIGAFIIGLALLIALVASSIFLAHKPLHPHAKPVRTDPWGVANSDAMKKLDESFKGKKKKR
jgi:hypothetical protein